MSFKKPEGYPFHRIAKQFGVDYNDVLKHADALQHHRGEQVFPVNTEIEDEIYMACVEQVRVRDGEIDWQTGAPL